MGLVNQGTISLFLACLLLAAYNDYTTRRIPNECIACLLGICGVFIWIFPTVTVWERLLGGLSIGLLLMFLSLIREGAFGGGDIKLMFVAGIALGTNRIFMAFALAVLTAGAYITLLMMGGRIKRKDTVALGPFLCVGILAAFFFDVVL